MGPDLNGKAQLPTRQLYAKGKYRAHEDDLAIGHVETLFCQVIQHCSSGTPALPRSDFHNLLPCEVGGGYPSRHIVPLKTPLTVIINPGKSNKVIYNMWNLSMQTKRRPTVHGLQPKRDQTWSTTKGRFTKVHSVLLPELFFPWE